MKRIQNIKTTFHNLTLLLLSGLIPFLVSCEKEEVQAVFKSGNPPALALNSQKIVLSKDNADKEAFVANWTEPDYGFQAGITYTVLFDKKGGDFSKAISSDAGITTKKSLTNSELNTILLNLGLEADKESDVDVKVMSSVQGISDKLASVVTTIKATPYSTKIDLSSIWGVVGSATTNGWDGPDQPFFKTAIANIYKAYVTLKNGEIKFRQNNKWDVNLGDTGADGTTEANGDNIQVKAGIYVITFDVGKNTYSIDKLSWALVGSATTNGWDGPDMTMTYNPYNDTWNIIATLKDGEMKFRLNNDWGNNFGDDGANGSIESNGANIAVTKGTYKIALDLTKKVYTITETKLWGIVGDATPTGWDGPDTKFTFDFINEIWVLNGIVLKNGEMKFRLGDDWGLNYGSDAPATGKLNNGGKNIPVTAGTYDVTLDLKDVNNLLFTLKKK